jgi:hypothetical protein
VVVEKAPQVKAAAQTDDGPPQLNEWGERIGEIPPEIKRQQDEMMARLVREANISPLESFGDSVRITPEASTKLSPGKEELIESVPDTICTGQPESVEWMPAMPGRAPPEVEAGYEVQLDAMRLPEGFVSKVRLPSGLITEVKGHGLRRPPSFEMDEFERRYWTTKPTLTKEMKSTIVELRAHGEPVCPSVLDEFLGCGQLSQDRFVLCLP